jgi:hypothetical protein
MAVPTITSVTPSTGPTRGRRLVKVVGTGYRLPPAPPSSGRPVPLNPSVQVLFGTEPALEVHVLSPTLLHVVSPVNDPGACDLVVSNLNQDGTLVAGETAIAPAAYTFARPNLNKTGANESILTRVVRTFMRELKRQLIENVELTVHTDYDDTPDGADVAMLAKLPGMVIVGPRMRENRFYSTNESREVVIDGKVYEQRAPHTNDVLFTCIGVHDTMQVEINFQNETILFFHGNKVLRVLADATVPGTYVDYEMEIEDQFSSQATANNSNVRAFSGTVVIRGVDLDDDDMVTREIFDTSDVLPSGAVGPTGGGPTPRPYALTGQPGITLPPPFPANPPATVGNTGPIEQIPPTDEE